MHCVVGAYFDIVFRAFDIQDFIQDNPHLPPVNTDINGVYPRFSFGCNRLVLQQIAFQPGQGLVQGLQKPVKTDGFQQVINRIQFKPVPGVFLVGGRKDHFWRVFKGLYEFRAQEFRHPYVQKEEIHLMGLQEYKGFYGIAEFADHLQHRQFFTIAPDDIPRQGFVINNEATWICGFKFFHRAMAGCDGNAAATASSWANSIVRSTMKTS